MRYELNFKAEPLAGHGEFLESFLEQEDFPRTRARATVTWYGPWPLDVSAPGNARSQLAGFPTLRWSGVYIVALLDPTQVTGYRPIRAGESKYLPGRLEDYLSPSKNPLARFPPLPPSQPVYFFFGRVQGDREMVQNALARLFLRAGVYLTHHDRPREPANVFADAPVTIRNVLPPQLRPYLALAYGAGGRDPRGRAIRGPYPGPQASWAPYNILHLTPSDTPVWEVEAVVGDRASGSWIRMGNRLIVLGA